MTILRSALWQVIFILYNDQHQSKYAEKTFGLSITYPQAYSVDVLASVQRQSYKLKCTLVVIIIISSKSKFKGKSKCP